MDIVIQTMLMIDNTVIYSCMDTLQNNHSLCDCCHHGYHNNFVTCLALYISLTVGYVLGVLPWYPLYNGVVDYKTGTRYSIVPLFTTMTPFMIYCRCLQ